MKKSVLFLAVTALLVSSCNVIDITKKRYSNGYHVSTSWGKNADGKSNAVPINKQTSEQSSTVDAVKESSTTEVAVNSIEETKTVNAPSESINTKTKRNVSHKDSDVATNKTLFTQKSSKLNAKKLQIIERKALAKSMRGGDSLLILVLLVILALLLPPVAVFIKKGIGKLFWLCLLFTILALGFFGFALLGLAWLIAAIIALYAVLA